MARRDLVRIAWKCLLLVPVALAVLLINYWVDPGNLFHVRDEAAIVRYLLDGYNVRIVESYDEALLCSGAPPVD